MNTASTNRVDRKQLALYQPPERARTRLGDHKLFNKRVEHAAKLITESSTSDASAGKTGTSKPTDYHREFSGTRPTVSILKREG